MGRRKIDIELVKDPNIRQVTFSKRRSGLFKKANELTILCDAEIAIVVFSPGNKPYSFGHPRVDVVATKYLQQEPRSIEAQNAPSSVVKIDEHNQEFDDIMKEVCDDEKKVVEHDEAIKQKIGTQRSELEKTHAEFAKLRLRVKDNLSDFEVAEIMILFSQKGIKSRVAKKKKTKKPKIM